MSLPKLRRALAIVAHILFVVFTAACQNKVIPLYSNTPPGSEGWMQKEREMIFPGSSITLVQNVVNPTLRVFVPPKEKANGTAIVLEPGGGWETIVEGLEGMPVADSLNAHGITVFMLRYRLLKTIDNFLYTSDKKSGLDPKTRLQDYDTKLKQLDLDDAKAAMKYVRAHAAEYNIQPNKIGFMGFSAGAFNTTVLATEYDSASRPDFVVPVYGAIENPVVPGDAPPLFIVHAADDKVVSPERSLHFYEAWLKAGKQAEIHIFSEGGHGFGVTRKGVRTDNWIALFFEWLQSEKII
ncbi:MAG TPA: alpha/beta hydrolase [Chitinophagaceae bacterium]|nr:alpha/beta hydrolase [Chitinophagaceae bacterium]